MEVDCEESNSCENCNQEVAKGSRKEKWSFYGQADRKGLPPPPYGQGVVIFSK